MDEKIFRQKSLEKVKSPENLDDYIQVSNPGVWLLLISVVVLLIGACVWGVFGHVDSIVTTTVRIDNGVASCYLSEEDVVNISEGMTVTIGEYDLVVDRISQNESSGYQCVLKMNESIPNGFYEGVILIKTIRPISFILN